VNPSIPRIRPPVYFLTAIVVMILLHSFFPITHWLASPWNYLGIVFIVLGGILTIRSVVLFRRVGTQTHPGVKATALVHEGPFRFTRNPMYLGLIIILVGVAILLGSVSPLLVIPLMIWILHVKFILREEKWMENWFGEPYLDYKKKTRRWL
jgi:protein-S-isoprenylcysteine O-methyltransferase Ste14